MSTVPNWFGRRFDFSFPLELLPNLCARLRGTPARLVDVFRGTPRLRAVRKPQGKWSAQENAGHLADLEPLWLARVTDYLEAKDELTPTDLQNRKTDEARHNDQPLESILKEFRSRREHLMERVQTLDWACVEKSIRHPRLKVPMRLVDHLHFVAEHDDHHLARIWELIGGHFIHDEVNAVRVK